MNLSMQSEFDLIGKNVTISESKNKEIVGINAVSYTHLTLPTKA